MLFRPQLYANEMDLFIGQISQTQERNRKSDFLTPLFIREMRFIHTWPKPIEDLGSLLYPLEFEAWIAVIVSFFVVAFLLIVTDICIGYFKLGTTPNHVIYTGLLSKC